MRPLRKGLPGWRTEETRKKVKFIFRREGQAPFPFLYQHLL